MQRVVKLPLTPYNFIDCALIVFVCTTALFWRRENSVGSYIICLMLSTSSGTGEVSTLPDFQLSMLELYIVQAPARAINARVSKNNVLVRYNTSSKIAFLALTSGFQFSGIWLHCGTVCLWFRLPQKVSSHSKCFSFFC